MTAAAASDVRRVLVADDELNMRRVLEAMLRREGYEVITAANGVEALGGMSAGVHTVITDLKMPVLDGMALLKRLSAEYPDVPVVMITAHGSVENAVEAVKLGAFDYLEKPFEQEQIRQVVAKAMNTYTLARRDARPEEPSVRGRFRLVGQAPAIRQIYGVVEKVASTPSTVLITGESGTGKELIARALHENSARHAGPFIKINCAAIPKTLMESELFGYEKGAFTGAVGAKPGRFELAHGGTLFLDEIGEIPVEMQVKLLRVLQESEFERVGGIKTIKVDVRLVTATNRDLVQDISAGSFREDLYYRLNVVPIHIPPLRERREDIPLLVEHFLAKFNDRLKKQIDSVSADAIARLVSYHWPGNIRELENLMERTMLFCERSEIQVSDLPPEIGGLPPMSAAGVPERRFAEGGRARRDGARRARADSEGARRDRRQRDAGGAQAQDLAQEPANEDEGAGPPDDLIAGPQRGAKKVGTGLSVVLSSGTALAADTFKKLSRAVVPVLMLVAWPARGAEVTRVVSAMDGDRGFDFQLTATWVHDVKTAFVKRELQTSQHRLRGDQGPQVRADARHPQPARRRRRAVGCRPAHRHAAGPVGRVQPRLRPQRKIQLRLPGASPARPASQLRRPDELDDRYATASFPPASTPPAAGSRRGARMPSTTGSSRAPRTRCRDRPALSWVPSARASSTSASASPGRPFNQRRDDTKPTWTLSFDALLDVFKDQALRPREPRRQHRGGAGLPPVRLVDVRVEAVPLVRALLRRLVHTCRCAPTAARSRSTVPRRPA